MRDKARILRITWKIADLWELFPDQRFSQLLENYLFVEGKLRWNEEDDKFEKRLAKAVTLRRYQIEKEGKTKRAKD